MLPQNHRLIFKEAANVAASGKRAQSNYFNLTFVVKEKPPSRWVVYIPKARIKNAVDRNRIRRQIHENLRLHISGHTLPHEGVLRTRWSGASLSSLKTQTELINIFTKSGLIK